ncbi:hypothetical protein BU25DRAFT_448224 [Macroventuria anomochaeta]|uniref:Uncharacterized protein n=1 Tax=Macroventuria anomochaeta TaxID=301207 RepID=A0ACB6S4J1_9PLEO|nr:uncharacterized protein BU25DRAFT_448224 [Macroventuria anomochaeta]KAF2628283.1 hypothetical protein BU25DRAFT_448224 [Macroventuria anomochaeta]
MSRISQIARFLLLIHGLLNIAQGLYCIAQPLAWSELAGSAFRGTPNPAVQSIGLGALGVGWYQCVFACQNNKALFIATIPLRIIYAAIIARWGGWKPVLYELAVWGLANCAAYL